MTPQRKTLAAVLVLAIGVGVFGVTLVRATLLPPQEAELPAPAVTQGKPAQAGDQPARLRIPSLGIDANVQRVGLGKSGNMAVPSNFTDVAWYKYGPAPGFVGSAVIDGHVDNGLSLAGVFKHLSDIKAGDTLEVESASGTVRRFVVSEVVVYPYKQVPADLIFNRQDKARLNLITCEGAWVAGEKTYDERLVVYTELAR